MKIMYTGNKPEKRVTVGTKELLFNPYCELNPIFDIGIINWLLHKDRAGLFAVVEVEDKTPSVSNPEATKVSPETPKEIIVEAKKEQEKIPIKNNRGRGRPKKR